MLGYVDIYVWFKRNPFLIIFAIYVRTDKSIFLKRKFKEAFFYD